MANYDLGRRHAGREMPPYSSGSIHCDKIRVDASNPKLTMAQNYAKLPIVKVAGDVAPASLLTIILSFA